MLPPAYVEALGGVPDLPAPLEGLEAMMERHEIDAAVVSTGPPGAFLGDPGRARELARIANEGIADVVRGAPERFAPASRCCRCPTSLARWRRSGTRSTGSRSTA